MQINTALVALDKFHANFKFKKNDTKKKNNEKRDKSRVNLRKGVHTQGRTTRSDQLSSLLSRC